jgi:hypothetical protein
MPATFNVATSCTACGAAVTLTTKSQVNNFRSRKRAYCSKECGRAAVKKAMLARGMPPQALAARHAQVRANNPMSSASVRAKVSATMRAIGHKPATRGGNGSGLTAAEQALSKATGLNPHVVPTGGKGNGYPTHYKLDLADPTVMLAIEVDGGSHKSLKVRAADSRKEEFLRGRGWTVLRFTNSRVLTDTISCAREVASTTSKLRANTPT